ncbi:MAG: hypothetical protein ABIA21_04055 [Candidatus Aenigmatarchaeota archaeon]
MSENLGNRIERMRHLAGNLSEYPVIRIYEKENGGFLVRYSDGTQNVLYLPKMN